MVAKTKKNTIVPADHPNRPLVDGELSAAKESASELGLTVEELLADRVVQYREALSAMRQDRDRARTQLDWYKVYEAAYAVDESHASKLVDEDAAEVTA